ncbi:MAG: VCBS repeat-containing protein, partial [Acidobacteria bacterium]|nr:VCBS repeat-containing protein [Acidobacteriota bacterium]
MTFRDLAREGGSGLEYSRHESPRETLLDDLKVQGTITFSDIVQAPMKSRGAPGVAILDFDGDGDLDLYVTNGPGHPNSLFSSQLKESGSAVFVDVAEPAGVAATDQDSAGVCFGDLDNDGDPDLLVLGSDGADLLFENLGAGRFADVTAASGLAGDGLVATSCSMGDVDGDGLLDIAVANAFVYDNQLPIGAEPFALNHHNQLW